MCENFQRNGAVRPDESDGSPSPDGKVTSFLTPVAEYTEA